MDEPKIICRLLHPDKNNFCEQDYITKEWNVVYEGENLGVFETEIEALKIYWKSYNTTLLNNSNEGNDKEFIGTIL